MEGYNLGRDRVAIESHNQEKMDEMLAASMQAEEEGGDEDEEMILAHGKVDPAVLASLPPSMQLDLLVQMREKLIAENRQRYQKVKKVPEKFSELQIQAYLKTVAFRREIDQVQKAATGNGVGGVQASRIASEANREFIFSSSFSGHKELLTTAGVKRNKGDMQQKQPVEQPSADVVDGVASIPRSSTVAGLVQDEPSSFDDDVETYLDERGRIRVSRVRAMGLLMTRDLQRNLDLMKEVEKEKTLSIKSSGACSEFNRNKIDMSRCPPPNNHNGKGSHSSNDDSVSFNNENGQSLLNSKTSVQISFEVGDESNYFSSDDEVFSSWKTCKNVF